MNEALTKALATRENVVESLLCGGVPRRASWAGFQLPWWQVRDREVDESVEVEEWMIQMDDRLRHVEDAVQASNPPF